MERLINYKKNLKRGDVLIFPAEYPYENHIKILLTELFHDKGRFGFVIISGQKSGLIFVNLPEESELKNEIGVSTEWVVKNWDRWFGFCNVLDVDIFSINEIK